MKPTHRSMVQKERELSKPVSPTSKALVTLSWKGRFVDSVCADIMSLWGSMGLVYLPTIYHRNSAKCR